MSTPEPKSSREVSTAVKRVKLSLPTQAAFDAGILTPRFFEHNKRLVIMRVFAVAQNSAILIAEIGRRDTLYTSQEIQAMRAELLERYSLEHFEVIEVDEERKAYTVLLRARVPDVLEGAWKSVGTEAFLDGPVVITPHSVSGSFMVLGNAQKPLELLDSLSVPYEIKEVRRGPRGSEDAALTREQRALLRMALDLGYYEVPARVNLTQLARFTGVSKAAMSKKLRRAERKILFKTFGKAG
jgi:hypothetical protein